MEETMDFKSNTPQQNQQTSFINQQTQALNQQTQGPNLQSQQKQYFAEIESPGPKEFLTKQQLQPSLRVQLKENQALMKKTHTKHISHGSDFDSVFPNLSNISTAVSGKTGGKVDLFEGFNFSKDPFPTKSAAVNNEFDSPNDQKMKEILKIDSNSGALYKEFSHQSINSVVFKNSVEEKTSSPQPNVNANEIFSPTKPSINNQTKNTKKGAYTYFENNDDFVEIPIDDLTEVTVEDLPQVSLEDTPTKIGAHHKPGIHIQNRSNSELFPGGMPILDFEGRKNILSSSLNLNDLRRKNGNVHSGISSPADGTIEQRSPSRYEVAQQGEEGKNARERPKSNNPFQRLDLKRSAQFEVQEQKNFTGTGLKNTSELFPRKLPETTVNQVSKEASNPKQDSNLNKGQAKPTEAHQKAPAVNLLDLDIEDVKENDNPAPVRRTKSGMNADTLKQFIIGEVSKNVNDWIINYNTLKIIKKIGSGGSAEVFQGTWRGTDVAIKKLNTTSIEEDRGKEFEREIAALVKMRPHNNLVALMGVSHHEDNLYIITEFCHGGTLFEWLHKKKDFPITWSQKIKIAKDIASGMLYLHTCEPPIVHRDLKSLNLLLDAPIEKNSDRLTVKIADFGLSKVQDVLEENMTGLMGTYHWMAPEVFDNKGYTLKADVFSYGIVLWEICTRQTPYKDLNSPAAIMKHVTIEKGRPDLTLISSSCPPEFIDLMIRCWDQNPSKRPGFQEILDFIKNLKKFGAGRCSVLLQFPDLSTRFSVR